jgi:sigma-B regulation protein RsbU (phosphoserine phosphatase)
MRAGTLVAAVKSFFSAVGGTLAPAQFLQRCSKLIQNLNLGRLHMAMLVIRIEGRTVRTATAGFPPALLFRANNGSVDELAAGGLPLGTRLDPAYEETELELAPGDTLLLASDGLAELLDPNGAPLDYTGVINAFKSAATLTPTEIVSSILAAADSWRDGVPQEDDITCVALQSTP